MRRFGPVALGLSVAGLAGACRTPRPVQFDPAQVARIEIRPRGGVASYCPYADGVEFDLAMQMTNGKVLSTPAPGYVAEGQPVHDQFTWTASNGALSKGHLTISADPFDSLGQDIVVEASVPSRPDVKARLALKADLGCGGMWGSSGDAGGMGSYGQSGSQGSSGSSASGADTGGNGGDGSDGGDGGDGSRGGDGGHVDVYLIYVDLPTLGRNVAALVVPEGRPVTRLLVPITGGNEIAIVAMGGAGGGGGSGGSGGNGGDGGDNSEQLDSDEKAAGDRAGDGGDGGNGGAGGRGGDGAGGGRGGSIAVYYDKRFPALATRFVLSTNAGPGGYGGSGGSGGQGGDNGDSYDGADGAEGGDGPAGAAGRGGPDGQNGPAPSLVASDVSAQFAFLADYGLAIAQP